MKNQYDISEDGQTLTLKRPDLPNKVGRPTNYSSELAAHICALVGEGKSLKSICDRDEMPASSCVYLWLTRHREFLEMYTRAKESSADVLTDELLDIADDGRNDWMELHDQDGKSIGYRVRGEAINRSRLRVDTRKWIASKLKPRKYGEHQQLDIRTPDGVRVEHAVPDILEMLMLSPEQKSSVTRKHGEYLNELRAIALLPEATIDVEAEQ
jgi:hypothetical protein